MGGWLLVAALAWMTWVIIRSHKAGVQEATVKSQQQTLENVEDAKEVRRDVARDPDPVKRLQDDWSRD